jgi:hypothetical protein
MLDRRLKGPWCRLVFWNLKLQSLKTCVEWFMIHVSKAVLWLIDLSWGFNSHTIIIHRESIRIHSSSSPLVLLVCFLFVVLSCFLFVSLFVVWESWESVWGWLYGFNFCWLKESTVLSWVVDLQRRIDFLKKWTSGQV